MERQEFEGQLGGSGRRRQGQQRVPAELLAQLRDEGLLGPAPMLVGGHQLAVDRVVADVEVLLVRLDVGGELIAIEANRDAVERVRAMVELGGVADRVQVVHATGEEAIPELTGEFDLVFIDHGSSSYLPDLLELERRELLAPNAILVADNIGYSGDAVSDYVEHVRTSGKYRSELHRSELHNGRPFADGVEVSERL